MFHPISAGTSTSLRNPSSPWSEGRSSSRDQAARFACRRNLGIEVSETCIGESCSPRKLTSSACELVGLGQSNNVRQAKHSENRQYRGELLPIRTIDLSQSSEDESQGQILNQIAVDASGDEERIVGVSCRPLSARDRQGGGEYGGLCLPSGCLMPALSLPSFVIVLSPSQVLRSMRVFTTLSARREDTTVRGIAKEPVTGRTFPNPTAPTALAGALQCDASVSSTYES